jgi:hypothetical protein
MAQWSYGRIIRYTQEECAERGIRAEAPEEYWSSMTCHRCDSTNTRRLTHSFFWCLDCGLQYNADFNGAINIGSVFLPIAQSRRATEGLAYAGNELAYKPVSLESEFSDSLKGTTQTNFFDEKISLKFVQPELHKMCEYVQTSLDISMILM